MPLSIEQILMQEYDTLKRDSNGTILYDKRLQQVAENLLNQRTVDQESIRHTMHFLMLYWITHIS